jgi:hypothetical protein
MNRKGNTEGAKKEMEKARDAFAASLGPEHPQTTTVAQFVDELASGTSK